jgi:hypothetical protein
MDIKDSIVLVTGGNRVLGQHRLMRRVNAPTPRCTI